MMKAKRKKKRRGILRNGWISTAADMWNNIIGFTLTSRGTGNCSVAKIKHQKICLLMVSGCVAWEWFQRPRPRYTPC